MALPKTPSDAIIVRMLDLGEIDLQLEQLGQAPHDIQALLERNLGSDRSLERVDALLATLADVTPTEFAADAEPRRRRSSHPPRALGRHARWVPPPQAPVPRVASSRTTLIGPLAEAAPRETSPAVEPSSTHDEHARWTSSPPPQAVYMDRDAEHDEAPEERGASHGGQDLNDDTQPSFTHEDLEASAAEAPTSVRPAPRDEAAEASERKREMKALLERDLDPNDFAGESAAPAPVAHAGRPAPATEDELELLIEDEELLEIADDDLEIVDDNE